MLNIESHTHEFGTDPAPAFATDAEIATAERLRHQLEERYLATAPAPATSLEGSREAR